MINIFKGDTNKLVGLGFCTLLALMLLQIYISLTQITSLNSSMSSVIQSTNAKIEAAYSMRDAIRQRTSSLKTIALTDDYFERDEELQRFHSFARNYRVALQSLSIYEKNQVETDLQARLADATRASQPFTELAADLLLSNKPVRETNAAIEEAFEYQSVLFDLLDQLIAYEKNSAFEATEVANQNYLKSRRLIFILASLSLLLGLGIAFIVLKRSAKSNRQIKHQANHDALTGLYNRHAFEQKFEELIGSVQKTESEHALLYLDLDQFKIVNDSCGHAAGDELLCQLTQILSRQLRQSDVLARLGGDEFGILLKDCDIASATYVAEALRLAVEKYRFSREGFEYSVGVSVGVVPVNANSSDMAKIMSTADMACLEAKQAGRNRIRVASTNDQTIIRRRSELDCVRRMKLALEEDRLELYFQPVISVAQPQAGVEHIEILVRMISSDGAIISPGDFIPVAERYGQMSNIDKWVVTQALEWLSQWQDKDRPPRLMVNLSGQSIGDETFLPFILEALDTAALVPGTVCFEITETAAIANFDKALLFISALKNRGCEFALDDFGSGMSSFTYLKELPVDYVKIDGSFVREIVDQPIDCAMVKSINDIGHVMGLKTIAEFVENGETLDLLRDIGVDYAQGYGIAMPQPLASFQQCLVEDDKRISNRTLAAEPAF